MNKQCPVCKVFKSVSSFNARSAKCKTCQSKYIKEHYLKNKTSYVAKAQASRLECDLLLQDLKDNKPCMDCKVVHRYFALDYDHRDPSKKFLDVSTLATYGKSKLLEEIVKCDLVCATCHRYRTWARRDLNSHNSA